MSANKKKSKSWWKRCRKATAASLSMAAFTWCATILLVIFHLTVPYEEYFVLGDLVPPVTLKSLIRHKRGFWRFISKSSTNNSEWRRFFSMVEMGTELFVFYWREIFVIVAIYFIVHIMSGTIYLQLPPWVQWLMTSQDDSEPPPLEDLSFCNSEQEDKSASPGNGRGAGIAETSRQLQGKEWLVYDPIFGVIPKETKDLWELQSHDRNDQYNRMIYLSRRRSLPPVRGSDLSLPSGHGSASTIDISYANRNDGRLDEAAITLT